MGDLDNGEILFRQIKPGWWDNEGPSSQNFCPTKKDRDKLSMDRSSVFSAKESYDVHIQGGNKSEAVFGVTVSEFRNETLGCYADPINGSGNITRNPAHAYVDYSAHNKTQQKKIAKRIKQKAIKNGQYYP